MVDFNAIKISTSTIIYEVLTSTLLIMKQLYALEKRLEKLVTEGRQLSLIKDLNVGGPCLAITP